MMIDRNILVNARENAAQYGTMTAESIIAQVREVLGDSVPVEDWREIVAVLDEITEATPR